MRLSKRAEYGVIASVRLAQRLREGGGYLRSRQIAEEEELPAKFLEAILLQLKSSGVLESKVGAGGGYRLTRRPDEVRVSEIVRCLEPTGSVVSDDETDRGGSPGRAGGRALIEVNRRVLNAYETALGGMTLDDLLDASDAPGSLGGAGVFGRDADGVRDLNEDRRLDEAAF
jgi:Rrf2 family protein